MSVPLPCAACGGTFPTPASRGQIVCETGHTFALVDGRIVSLDPGVALDPDTVARYEQQLAENFSGLFSEEWKP